MMKQKQSKFAIQAYDQNRSIMNVFTYIILFSQYYQIMMNYQERIYNLLQDGSFQQAISFYENNLKQYKPSILYRIAKAYHIEHDYQKVLNTLQKIQPNRKSLIYQIKMLEIKARYLLRKDTDDLLKELEKIVAIEGFNSYHKSCVNEVKSIINTKLSEELSKQQLKEECQQYKKIYKQELEANAISYEGFPIFLISKKWFNQWKFYVNYQENNQINKNHPGPITQFQLLDHLYNCFIDPEPQKDYTNKYLFATNQYELLTKQCWQFFKNRYGGIPISRVNISNSSKPNITVTQIQLTKLLVFKSNKKQDKYYIQISRKETWKNLLKKIARVWGEGRIWRWEANAPLKINLNNFIEDEDIPHDSEIIYEVQQNKKWIYNLPPAKEQKPEIKSEKCGNCGKTESLKFCQCRLIKYCNMECLKNHRNKHRKDCESKKQSDSEMIVLLSKFNLQEERTYSGSKGIVGLRNLGNTCFMNSGIQCLSNTKEITDYFMSNKFLQDINSSNPLGSSGVIACSYAKLIREMWSGKDDQLSPSDLKKAISRFAPQFTGYSQHDSQELISTLLDGLHEDTNLVKVKPSTVTDDDLKQDQIASKISEQNYAKRNKSLISDLTVGQFKSKLVCPKCNKVSIIFDPFMLISLPIPQNIQMSIFLVTKKLQEPALKVIVVINVSDLMQDIIQRIGSEFQIEPKKLKFLSLDEDYKIVKQYQSSEHASNLYKDRSNYNIFCYEIEEQDNQTINYVTNYYTIIKGKQQIATYPRFLSLKKNVKIQAIQAEILKGLDRFIKQKNLQTKPVKQIFDIEIKTNEIKVALKISTLKLATYRETRKEITAKNQDIDLNNCFDLFIKQEKLDSLNSWYCNKCKAQVEATKKMDIYKTNKILLLGLKRFRYGRKIKTKVNFPIKRLDLTRYVLSNTEINKPIIYELYAVSNHYGTMGGGHYTAFCKNFLNNKWYEFNDSRVGKVNEEEIVSSSAYVLFYRRID